MIHRLSTGFATLGCVLLAACYPVNENPHPNKTQKTPEKTPTAAETRQLKEQEALKQKELQETAQNPSPDNPATDPTNPPTEKIKAPVEPKRDYAVANKVPGKEGFVFSPYNNKVVDVREIASGTLVTDPTYPTAEKKFFRVP